MRHDFSAETEYRPVFTVPQPLPERQRDAEGNYPPDPPLPEPYPGYSMMNMLRAEGAGTHPIVRRDPVQIKPINGQSRTTAGSKKKKKKA